MNTVALELPEDKSLWPTWFEQQLLGSDLRLLIRQLELMTGQSTSLPDGVAWEEHLLAEFSELVPGILSHGLSILSPADLQRLIRKPRLLLALQELVFIEGGEYWKNLQRSESSIQSIQLMQESFVLATKLEIAKPATSQNSIGSTKNSLKPFLYVSALAASFLLAIYFFPPASQGRYFAREGLLTSAMQGNDFCKTLASAIREDWDPNAAEPVFRRQLQELKDSCDRLINASLPQLEVKVASDLRNRCTKWKSSLTDMLAGLDSGRPVDDVRQNANELVERLVKVLGDLG